MSKSKAQKFAQQRNTAGGCLKGVIKNLENTIRKPATAAEQQRLDSALNHLKILHDEWGDNYEQAKDELL